jgi:hypothetical protein
MGLCISYLYTSKKRVIQSGGMYFNIITELGIPVKLVMLIKLCLNETCIKIRTDKHFSDAFQTENSLEEGDAISSLLLNFASECRRKQRGVGTEWDTYQLVMLFYWVKKSTEVLLDASKEVGR